MCFYIFFEEGFFFAEDDLFCPPFCAMVRRKMSVLFKMIPRTMLKLPVSASATFSHASRILSKAHSVAFVSTLNFLSKSSQSPSSHAKYPNFIILGVQSVSALLLTCSRTSLAGDSCCHWPCLPSCLSFSASLRPHSWYKLIHSNHFPQPATMRFLFHHCPPLP